MRLAVCSHFPTVVVLLVLMLVEHGSSYNLPASTRSSSSHQSTVSRREAVFGTPFVVGAAAVAVAFAPSTMAQAKDDNTKKPTTQPEGETEQEKKARIMKEKIAASKTSYRKAESKDKSPFRLLGK
mmetsp:Transcript_61167/g.70327  ORF Transcript_61167/g.70327 Transcript_61167/m.70327 type:complete len:126 (+) Transcript_61167:68-445(+)